jgi:hypothetical protein
MYRVGTKCNNGSFVYGNVFEFKMPDVDSARLENCGMIPDIDLSNREPLQELNVGDVFMASDYPVTVTKVTNGSNGVFSGEGWVMLRWILNVRVAVEFENLPINTDKRATGGEVNFKYNKDWKNVGNLDGSGGNGGSDGQGIRIADTVIDFVIPGVDAFDLNCSDPTTDCEIIIHGENGETATIIIPRDSTGQLGLPYIIKDADGNTFIVDKNTTGQDSDVSVTSASSASVYPHFIGYAADLNESKVYFCNTQNVSEEEKLANAIQAKRQLIDNIIDCSVTVKEQGVFMSWYKAESIDILKQLKPQTMKFEIKLNGEIKNPDGNSIVIYKDDLLDDGESDCELSMINEETNTRKLMAKYKLSKYVPLPDTYYVIELEKDLAGNKRKDFYTDNGIAGHSNDEMPFADKEKIRLSILKIHRGIDTALYSTAQTEWYVNDTKIYTGAYFDYTIEQDIKNPIIKAVTDTNNIKVEIEIIKNPIADGRVNLDYSAVQNNSRDVADATNYFNASLPRCKTGDVGRFIDNSPKPVIVKVERRPATGGTVTQGEANDGADIKTSSYNKLDLKSINKDGYNAIIDAKLVSKLNPENVNGIQTSVNDGRPTQKTEILISRVARISQENADTLKAMINRKETRQGFLDSLVYEIREDDDISEWITFHNRDNIEIMINLENLGNDATANTPQKDFTRLMAHEFLHHYWTHFKQYEKLKWKIIRDKQTGYDYRLSDGMASGNAQDSNQGCSKGAGHERHNPEHSKVCNEQNSY